MLGLIFNGGRKMIIAPNSKVVFMGDSITDCGRTQPVGEGLFGPFGNGWVNVVVGLIGAAYPAHRLRLVNMGTSGHNVRDLDARWERDVFEQKPDWVAMMIGTNDVWRQFDSPLQPETHVYLEEYAATLEKLVSTTVPTVKGMVLMTPFYLEPNRSDAMRAMMDRYGAAVKDIAAKYGTLCVDTQAAMAGLLRNYHSAAVAWDRVHPNIVGHTVLAKSFLDAVGFKWNGK
jgi:lysophospholipase L1-like esterase